MLFRGILITNERYIKDPDYEPQGGKFNHRFPELKRLIAPSQKYAYRQATLLSALPKMIESGVDKYIETNEDFQKAKVKAIKEAEKFKRKKKSTQELASLAHEKILKAAIASEQYQKNEYSDAKLDNQITNIWNKTVNSIMLKAKQRKTSQDLNTYKTKIYLIHKLFINDVIEIIFTSKPQIKINIEKFSDFYKKLSDNDLMRFRKEFKTNNNTPSILAINIENDFNRELLYRKNWRPLLLSSISPRKISINKKIKEDIDRSLFPNIPILFENLIYHYTLQPKKAFIVKTGKEKPIFVDKMLGYLYIDKDFWESTKNNKNLRKTILNHEATHVRFNILINKDEFAYKKLIKKSDIAISQFVTLFGSLGGMTGEEIKNEIEIKKHPIQQNRNIFSKDACETATNPQVRANCRKIESLKEFIIDGEVFDKSITHQTRKSFTSFMQSRHTDFNRYKIEEFRKMGCFEPLAIKPSIKNLKDYDEIHAALIEGNPYAFSKNSDCAIIQAILNRNNLP